MFDSVLFNDSDMKIAGFHREMTGKKTELPARKLQSDPSENAVQAARLGAALWNCVFSAPRRILPELCDDCGEELQQQILFCFVAEAMLELLTDSALSQAAKDTLESVLQEKSPQFYHDLRNSPAFSFYLQALRRGGAVEHRIGRVYALLNQQEKNGPLTEVGEALYASFCHIAAECIRQSGLSLKEKTP